MNESKRAMQKSLLRGLFAQGKLPEEAARIVGCPRSFAYNTRNEMDAEGIFTEEEIKRRRNQRPGKLVPVRHLPD